MKNEYRITLKLQFDEYVPTTRGNVNADKWCKQEVARNLAKGTDAVYRREGKYCWVSRRREECVIPTDSRDSPGIATQ